MAGYSIFLSEKNEAAVAILGQAWYVPQEHFYEFRKLIERQLGAEVPREGHVLRFDDPKYQSIGEWLSKNGTRVAVLRPASLNDYCIDNRTSTTLVEMLRENVVAEIDENGKIRIKKQ